jgi:hypothetical protein
MNKQDSGKVTFCFLKFSQIDHLLTAKSSAQVPEEDQQSRFGSQSFLECAGRNVSATHGSHQLPLQCFVLDWDIH